MYRLAKEVLSRPPIYRSAVAIENQSIALFCLYTIVKRIIFDVMLKRKRHFDPVVAITWLVVIIIALALGTWLLWLIFK